MLNIREILRRMQLGQGDRAIARDLTTRRKTASKYRDWAAAEGLVAGPLPEPAALRARLVATLGDHPPRGCPVGPRPIASGLRRAGSSW